MKFDVIISNPPYQLSDGGSKASAMPIYNRFIEQAKKMKPRYMTMIIPSRWFAGGRALDTFRDNMLNDDRIKKLVDFTSSQDCFPGVDIAGGVCYFLWDQNYHGSCEVVNKINGSEMSEDRKLNEYSVFIRNNVGVNIIRKVLLNGFISLNTIMCNYNPFLIRSFERGVLQKDKEHNVKLISSGGIGYIRETDITKNRNLVDKYKVIVGKVTSEHAGEADKNGQYKVLSSLRILSPREVCSESYVVIGSFNTYDEAKSLGEYLRSKLIRFLILQAATSINLTQDTFMFVPLNDFSIPWDDNLLYKKYNLSSCEIEFVESIINDIDYINIK